MIQKAFSAKASTSGRTIKFIVSDETVDRDGDILVASGCDFTEFQKNPQFLGFHNSRDFPMGIPKAWGIDLRAKNVWMDVYFPTIEELATDPATASEKARQVDTMFKMYELGMLNAVSVGFKILESSPIENSWGKRISKWQLAEVSAVPIPANPNAVATARGEKSFDPSMVDEMEKSVMDEKSGRAISAVNREKLKGIHDRLTKAHEEMKGCHKELADFFAEPAPEGGTEDEPKGYDLDKIKEYLRISGK